MSQRPPEIVILSGGSEVSALAVAAAAVTAGIPYAAFSLVPHSVLRGAPGCVRWVDLSPHVGEWTHLRSAFLRALAGLTGETAPRLALLPTEDGGLRMLNECRDEVLGYGDFPRARTLRMGGVDKAEVAELAERVGVTAGLARSIVLDDLSQAGDALGELGPDAVFKPALKPISMDLSSMGGHGAKVVTRQHVGEPAADVIRRLRKTWSLSRRWIVQPRLRTGNGLERSVCAVRGRDIHACQVVERGKYPAMGGTAYWVSTDQRQDLMPSAQHLLEALDVVGICELSYLPDAAGAYHMIEFNPRPWLQVGLVEFAGFPIVTEAVTALRGGDFAPGLQIGGCDWVQLERMALALLAGQFVEWRYLLPRLFRASTVIAGYGGVWPAARRRMLGRLLRRAVGKKG